MPPKGSKKQKAPTTEAILEKYFEMFRGKIDKEGELPQAASG